MSETYHYKGKLKSTDLTVLDFINNKSKENNTKMESWAEDDPVEWFHYCNYNEKYIIIDNVVYEFIEQIKDDDMYFCTVKQNHDGTIDYEAVFHNSGTDLSEMLEQAFDALPQQAPDHIASFLYRISCVDTDHAKGVLARLKANDFESVKDPCIFGKDVLYMCDSVLDAFAAYQATKELSGDNSYRTPGSNLSTEEINFYFKHKGDNHV